MNLNRNNYEEFFLLYVDGELDQQQKQQVEEFVQVNPDLQQELDMLNEAVLQIDDALVFGNKASLYRSFEEGAINMANYQENFLLYVDNELNGTSREAVETFVLQHPAVQDEFTLLKQTKLQPELIAYPDKEALYKKEEERRPVVFMWAKKLAVAAAILFFAVMAWLLMPKGKTIGPIDVTAANQDKKNTVPSVTPTPVNPLSTGTKEGVKTGQQVPMNVQQLTAEANHTDAKKLSEKKGNKSSVTNGQQVLTTIAPLQNAIAVNQVPVQRQEPIIAAAVPKEQVIVSVKSNNATVNKVVPTVNSSNAPILAQNAVYRELDTDDEENKGKTVYIGSMEIKKDKIDNLFKKAKKLFGRKQNDDAKESIASNSRALR